jgi:hypothetical protein
LPLKIAAEPQELHKIAAEPQELDNKDLEEEHVEQLEKECQSYYFAVLCEAVGIAKAVKAVKSNAC